MNELTATYQQNTTVLPEAFTAVETGSQKSPGKINGCFFQGLDYYPFGSLMPGRNLNASDYRFGFNGMESDDEIAGNKNSYTTHFRQYDPRIGRWLSVDPKDNIVPHLSPYNGLNNNPVLFIDVYGDSVWVYSRKLVGGGTHTFISTKDEEGNIQTFSYGPGEEGEVEDIGDLFGDKPLKRVTYSSDKEISESEGKTEEYEYEEKIYIEPPKGKSIEEFTQDVVTAGESFGENPEIKYNVLTGSETTGNCNTSTTTILYKAGVPKFKLKPLLKKQISGKDWGLGSVRPWTSEEQKEAVTKKKKQEKAPLEAPYPAP
jgi:RHS repeat-associated protein